MSAVPTIQDYFHPRNVREFLEKYTHFHAHFAMLHIATFRAMDAYVGLLVAMCCAGACYSDRLPAANTRDIMDFLRASLENSSRMYAALAEGAPPTSRRSTMARLAAAVPTQKELQAIVLTHIMSIWHGTPLQRDKARCAFPLIAQFARRAGLLSVAERLSTV